MKTIFVAQLIQLDFAKKSPDFMSAVYMIFCDPQPFLKMPDNRTFTACKKLHQIIDISFDTISFHLVR